MKKRTKPAMKFEVYKVDCLVTGKAYVGKTVYTGASRMCGHKRAAKIGSNGLLARAIAKYGIENFRLTILYQGSSDREIFAVERAMIAQYRTFKPHGYNLSIGGEGPTGNIPSSEHREKVRVALSGNKNGAGNKGRKNSPETIAKMLSAQKDKIISPETRIKMAASMRGKKMPPEFGAKISESAKTVAVICTTNDTIYRSVSLAAKYLGIRRSNIHSVLSGRYKQSEGYHFVRAL